MAVRKEEVRVTADVSNFTTKLATAGASARAFAKELDSADSRMGNLVQTGLALAPALIPLGAVAVPAVTALAAGLGSAALGAGVAVLAFNGLSDALTAANNYALDPTAAHLSALQQKLETIGPAGREFVVFLQNLRPELQSLQNAAQSGFFPGLEQGMKSLMNDLPAVQRVISSTSQTLGDLAAQSGKSLDSKYWRDFLKFLSTDAQVTLADFAHSTGNVISALAAMWQAFTPINNDFSAGLVQATQTFEDWAKGLSGSNGFTEFTAYIRESGPQVIDTLKSLANAVLQIVEAAAPLGGPTLAVIRAVADTLAAIADSPAGPVLIGAAAGLSAMSRAIALYNVANGSALVGTLGKLSTINLGSIKAMPGALLAVTSAQERASLSATQLVGMEAKRAASFREGLANTAKIGAGIAGITLLMSDFDNKFALSNTAALTLTGTMAGPFGAAIGAGIGAVMDLNAANDKLEASIRAVDTVAASTPTDFKARQTAIESVTHATAQLRGEAVGAAKVAESIPGVGFIADKLSNDAEAGDKAVTSYQATAQAVSDLGNAFQGNLIATDIGAGITGNMRDYTDNVAALTKIAESAAPALAHLGITLDDLGSLKNQTGLDGILGAAARVEYDSTIGSIVKFNKAQDSIPGRSMSVAAAIKALGDPMLTTAQSADALSQSLDALFAPDLNLSQATDDWAASLRHLNDELAKHSRALVGNTDAAKQNRDVIRARAGDLVNIAKLAATAGEGPAQVAKRLADMRESLIRVGKQAGLSGADLRKFLDTLNLTPKAVRTIFEQVGIDRAEQNARSLRDAYNALPKDVRTDIAANGVPASATVASLMKKYDGLTHKDATTILKARDSASGVIDGVLFRLNQLHNREVLITARYNTINTVTDRHLTTNHADGGYISGPGGPRDDQIPAWLSNGEFVVNAAATARNLGLLHQINAQKFAAGGPALSPLDQRRAALADQRTVAQGLRTFNPQAQDTARDVRAAMRSLEQTLRGVLGKDAPLLDRLDGLGSRIVAATRRQDMLQKSLTDMTNQLRNLRQAQNQYRQEVSGSINNDPFGNGLSGFNTQLRADRNDNRKMLKALKEAQRKGLDGPLLRAAAASGDLEFVQELAALGRRGIHKEEQLFNARQRAQGALGDFAANQVYGERVREQTQAVNRMRDRVEHMTKRIDRLDDRIEGAVRHGAHTGTQSGIEGRNRRAAAKRGANR